MEGLLEMTFRPSQHNVEFRSVFGSISGGFGDHFREVFGLTSGSEGVLKLSSFSVVHFDAFRVHLGSPTAPMLAPFSGPWGVPDYIPSLPLLRRCFFTMLAPANGPKIDPMDSSWHPKCSQNRLHGAILAFKMVTKSFRWSQLGYYCYYCYCCCY